MIPEDVLDFKMVVVAGSAPAMRLADKSAVGTIMQMNQILRLAEQSATGRSIGAGRDKSGPTGVPRPFTIPLFFR